MTRFPMTPAEFAAMPPDELVEMREFVSTREKRGYLPYSRSLAWKKLKANEFPKQVNTPESGMPAKWRVKDIIAHREAEIEAEAA